MKKKKVGSISGWTSPQEDGTWTVHVRIDVPGLTDAKYADKQAESMAKKLGAFLNAILEKNIS